MVNPNVTTLLPPSTAVKIAWAMTGFFVKNNPESQDIATEAKEHLDSIIERAKRTNDTEKAYVNIAAADIEATMRTLDTIYKGRELNLEENDKLRAVTLKNIEEDSKFGRSAQDFLKSLPTMAIAAGAGTVTLNEVLESASLPGWSLWLIGLGFAGIGFFINLWVVKLNSRRRQKLYIQQDYERTIYFQQYMTRVRTALIILYTDIDRAHNQFFKKKYPLDKSVKVATVVKDILRGAMPTLCEEIHRHIQEGKITTDLWTLCDAGIQLVEGCKYWPPGKKPQPLTP